MPEKAEKKRALAVQKKKLLMGVLCKHINIILTIQRSISIKELLGLKNIDSIEHKDRKTKI